MRHVCQHQMPRSPRHPVGDLPCGRNAKHIVLQEKIKVCGTHANYWKARGCVVLPILQIKD